LCADDLKIASGRPGFAGGRKDPASGHFFEIPGNVRRLVQQVWLLKGLFTAVAMCFGLPENASRLSENIHGSW
jgi:hypothetical protein